MIRFWTQTWWVAVYETGEALRTRLFQLVILAYLGGIGFMSWMFLRILREMESGVASQMGLPPTERPGALIHTLLDDGSIAELIGPMVGGSRVTELLGTSPPLALWIGAASMFQLPVLLLFTSSGSVAAEVKSRTIRYLACRTGRLQIGLGKLIGHAFVGGVAAALGVVLAWVIGMTAMIGNEPGELFVALVGRTLWSCAYGLPFIGLGLAASQIWPHPHGARVLAGGVFGLMPVAGYYLDRWSGPGFAGRIADLVALSLPIDTWSMYWTGDVSDGLAAAARGLVLGVAYYVIGYVVFIRRDL